MPVTKLGRRELFPLALTGAGLLAVLRPALSQAYIAPPTNPGVERSQEAQCSTSDAIISLGEYSETFRGYLEISIQQLTEAIVYLQSINADNGSDKLPNPGRFTDEVLSILPHDEIDSLDTNYDHARLLLQAAEECLGIIKAVLEDGVDDEQVVRLFRLFSAISLLNASAVGFAT